MLACAIGCAGAPRVEVEPTPGPTPWTGLDVADDARDFTFAVVSDRTSAHRDGRVRTRGRGAEPALARVRGERRRPDRRRHGRPGRARRDVGRVRRDPLAAARAVLPRAGQPRLLESDDGARMGAPLRALVLLVRLQGRAVPRAEQRAVLELFEPGAPGRGRRHPARADALHRARARRAPRCALDGGDAAPAVLGHARRARRLGSRRGVARRPPLHRARGPLPPLCAADSARPRVHHARHDRRRQPAARDRPRRVRPRDARDDARRRPRDREPDARRHPRRGRASRSRCGT